MSEKQFSVKNNSDQAHQVVFSRKQTFISHSSVTFNEIPLAQTSSEKHLRMILDDKQNFEEHINHVIPNVNKKIGVIQNLQNVLPRPTLLTIYKSFIRPHLD